MQALLTEQTSMTALIPHASRETVVAESWVFLQGSILRIPQRTHKSPRERTSKGLLLLEAVCGSSLLGTRNHTPEVVAQPGLQDALQAALG